VASPTEQGRVQPCLGRLIAAYVAVAGIAVAVAGLLGSATSVAAAALGGLAGVVPQAWFAWRVLRRGVLAGDAQGMLRAMYWGEAVKLAAVAVILVGIFRYWPTVPPLPLLATFVAVQAVHWATPLLLES